MSEKQLLIESSDFNLTCNLSEKDRENLTESLKISAGKHGNLIVKNIPCTILDRRNQNGRIYPTALMQKAINEAMPKMKAKMLVCSASEHPSGSFCEPANISHAVINAYIKNVEIEVEGKKERHNVLFNDWEVLNEKSQVAAHVQQLILSGFGIGTSIRSLGSCDPDGTVTELEYLGTDIVGQPSSSTYVNMPINESVEVTTIPLTETYVVSASATNVVRDLDSALALSQQIDSANFGTVKKTSTKLDSEVDPKTGAETTMVTLETETEDEVSELDQALMMAKQAMLNGKADIDSVTIENIKEEQPKESVENKDTPVLNEDEYVPESVMNEVGVDKLMDEIRNIMYNEGLSLEQACRKYCEHHENIPYEYVLEYMRTNPVTESVMVEEPLKAILSYTYGTDGWYIAKLDGSLANLQYIDKQLNELIKTGHTLITDKDKPYIDFDYMNEKDMAKLLNSLQNKLHVRLNVYNPTADVQAESNNFAFDKQSIEKELEKLYAIDKSTLSIEEKENLESRIQQLEGELTYENLVQNESVVTEAKEEKQEDPNEGKQYVLKTNQGFIAMDGNAISFVQNPKEAIHFIKGKEESGVIHLSGINKILETMGIYDVQKYFKKGTTDISAPNDINIQNAKNAGIEVKECGNIDMPMTEDNGSNTRFKATVKIADENGESSEDIPVSAVDMEGINAEISNLYDMKKQKGNPVITVTDTTSGQQFAYNPESRQIELMNIQTEASGDLKQNGNKLSMEIDDNNKVEKEFNSPVQAAVAKAGIEAGKLGGDVLLSEDDEESDTAKCAWCGEEFEKSALRKEKDLGYLCNTCAKGIQSREGSLTFEEDLANDPYIYNQGKDEIDNGQEPDMNKIADSIRYIAKKTDCSLKDAMDIYEKITGFKFDEKDSISEEVHRPNYEDIEPGWYAGALNVGVTGPYESKEALFADLSEVADKINIEYISPEDLGLAAESSKIDEVLYNKPSKASDPLIKTPLEEDDDESPAVNILFKNIDWNTKDFMNSMMANMENDDPVNIEDIKSKVKDLPDEATITVKVNEIPLSNDSLLEKFLFDKLGKKYAMKVNNAEMANISWAV